MKTTAEMIEVMQAWERGEKIEVRDVDEETWGNLVAAPSWNWRHHDYRIKPREPRVIWVNEFKDGDVHAFTSEDAASEWVGKYVDRTAVKYVEVIE